MRIAHLAWVLGLSALGCPLLVDNQLEVVPESPAGSAGVPGAEPHEPSAGAPGTEPPQASAGSPPTTPSAGGQGGVATCGVSRTPEPGVACPAVCHRCEEGYCLFDCNDDEVCQEQPLDCPAGWACRVSCTAQASCNKARINCPAGFDCDVECVEVDSCKEAVVTCASGNCQVRCDVDKACEKTKVNCSTGHCAAECLAPMHAPMLACAEACACQPC